MKRSFDLRVRLELAGRSGMIIHDDTATGPASDLFATMTATKSHESSDVEPLSPDPLPRPAAMIETDGYPPPNTMPSSQMKLEHSEPSSRIRRAVRDALIRRYGVSRGSVRTMICKYLSESEGGECFSNSLREIFRTYYGVDVGLYTMGCFRPHAFGRGTTIGRFSSVARTAFAATLNHPLEFKSTHAFFFNPRLGYVNHTLESSPLHIGNDVWLGHNSVIMPAVSVIGDGAVVAAGAVVNKDVPPYAIVVGNPARVVRYRFDNATIERLLAERWWEQELSQLLHHINEFNEPLD